MFLISYYKKVIKKNLPYILISIIILAGVLLLYTGQRNRPRTLDERVSFRKRDKIPYGTYVAYKSLKNIFPAASVIVNKQEPGFWDSLSKYDNHQALIIVCPDFMAEKSEMKTLVEFAETGNDVFISTMNLSYAVAKMLNCEVHTIGQLDDYFLGLTQYDTLTVSLARPPFTAASYRYPGKKYDGYFTSIDTTITTVMGYDDKSRPDFIRFKAGRGNLYIHLAPMAFTNYFLLHKNNFPYYENALSVIPPTTTRVAWDEFYLYKRTNQKPDEKKGWLSTLLGLKNPDGKQSFAKAFWVLLLLLVLYTITEMKRKQRYIPVVRKPRNDSLDFVKTIGRLYHDKADHKNLCRKMAAYFLEHVRTRYKLPTAELDNKFVQALHAKTGIAENELNGIVYFIRELDNVFGVGEKQLIAFHHQLELFYKKE